ncbi:MAG: hypothetical protein PHX50_13920 [Massilibacteroides sp.]|nr:hypothetical protein [Massilibacteroides sp.]
MKFNEFMKSKMTAEEFEKDILSKKYLPIAEKKYLIEEMIGVTAARNEQGVYSLDFISMEIIPVYVGIINYTNLEIDEDPIEVYDTIKEFSNTPSGKLLNDLIKSEDFVLFTKLFNDSAKERIREENDITVVIARIMDKIAGQIPETEDMLRVIEETKDAFKGISTKKLNGIKSVIEGFNTAIK